jgi:hypothetical protein
MLIKELAPKLDVISTVLEGVGEMRKIDIAAIPHIDVVNESTVLTDALAAKYTAAVATQLSRDFRPHWGRDTVLHFVPKGAKKDPAHWWVAILDNSDVAGALGYHDMTNEGLPLGKVFAGTDLADGLSPSVTLSHEILEMIPNPWINLVVMLYDTVFLTYEDADPVEADSDGYPIGEVQVSDFVLPNYFQQGMRGPWDFRGLLKGPMPAIRPEGYLGEYVVGSGWTQVNGELIQRGGAKALYRALPKLGSRRERCIRARHRWVKSEAANVG